MIEDIKYEGLAPFRKMERECFDREIKTGILCEDNPVPCLWHCSCYALDYTYNREEHDTLTYMFSLISDHPYDLLREINKLNNYQIKLNNVI